MATQQPHRIKSLPEPWYSIITLLLRISSWKVEPLTSAVAASHLTIRLECCRKANRLQNIVHAVTCRHPPPPPCCYANNLRGTTQQLSERKFEGGDMWGSGRSHGVFLGPRGFGLKPCFALVYRNWSPLCMHVFRWGRSNSLRGGWGSKRKGFEWQSAAGGTETRGASSFFLVWAAEMFSSYYILICSGSFTRGGDQSVSENDAADPDSKARRAHRLLAVEFPFKSSVNDDVSGLWVQPLQTALPLSCQR